MRADLLHGFLAAVLLSLHFCIATASTRQQTFTTLTDATKTIWDLGYKFTNTTPISCGIMCMTSFVFCRSFIHSERTGECRGGSWLVSSDPSTQIVNDEKIYHSSNFCNTTDFFIRTTENYTYCIFLSNINMNYTSARNDCKARSAHLFTPKNAEKFQLMKEILEPIGASAWFGLNDLVTEGDFRWEDDGTEIDPVWKTLLFAINEPSASTSDEDCVMYLYPDYINDYSCWHLTKYMCEIDFN